ncbi:PHP domain-containing protein [Schnuerera sp. xch1]|uniref:PHP domain-containing protein n=1 Tax=Schnuerera sp. xch1 TaxID=2874283 RepID=UPI001CBCF4CD|nr:PHP domain-containing protein [Schnuerera sp. xch1]MBZ2175909.1 PHP domain-containing protein [Schnuerera sp. xch1]
MKITADYHTHTIYSHGKGTIRENVEVALERGLKEIGICDHGPGHYMYGVKREKLFKMRKEVDKLNEEYKDKGIKVLLGVEANIIGYDGTIDVDDDIIDILDILLLGFHYGVLLNSINEYLLLNVLNPVSNIIPLFRDKLIKKNTNAIIKAIEKYPIDIITHPGDKARLDIKRIAEAAYERGIALEINAKHNQLSVENIKIALDTKVDFYINSDAHYPEDVGNVEEGFERAKKANVPINRIKNVED